MFYDFKNKVIIKSNDDDFYEDKFPFKLRNNVGTTNNHILIIKRDDESIKPDITEPRKGKIVRVAKEYGFDYTVNIFIYKCKEKLQANPRKTLGLPLVFFYQNAPSWAPKCKAM